MIEMTLIIKSTKDMDGSINVEARTLGMRPSFEERMLWVLIDNKITSALDMVYKSEEGIPIVRKEDSWVQDILDKIEAAENGVTL